MNSFSSILSLIKQMGLTKSLILLGLFSMTSFLDVVVYITLFPTLNSYKNSLNDLVPELSKYLQIIELEPSIKNILIIILIVSLFRASIKWCSILIQSIIVTSLEYDIKQKNFCSTFDLKLNSFESRRTSDYSEAITTHVDQYATGLLDLIRFLRSFAVSTVYLITFILAVELKLSLFLMALIGLVSLPLILLNRRIKSVSELKISSSVGLNQHAIKSIQSYKYIIGSRRTDFIFRIFMNRLQQFRNHSLQLKKLNGLFESIKEFLLITFVLATLGYGIFIGVSAAKLGLALILFYRFGTNVTQLVGTMQRVMNAVPYFTRIINYQDFLSENCERDEINLANQEPAVIFSNFRYGFKDDSVLWEFDNLTIPRVGLYAINGKSGSGKTTLMSFLSGNRRDFSISYAKDIFEHGVGLVVQDNLMFDLSLRDNIVMGEEFVESKFLSVLDLCYLKDLVNGLDCKADTLIGESGVQLSGGQKRRVALAREIYCDRKVMILDEPLTGFDDNLKDDIMLTLKLLSRTKLIISSEHDGRFLKFYDHIINLDDN